jgi:diphosphomevalonate decarboxylase
MPLARRASGRATFEAAPNIALIKYWGDRDPTLVLPNNSSLSVTLDRMRTRTTVAFDPDLSQDTLELNGRAASGQPLDDVVRLLDVVRARAGIRERAAVHSANNFPTASGLASSASGFAALAGAGARAAGLMLSDRALSQLARLGSGSACRSVFGGFVEWRAGNRPDGSDCYARPLYPPGHWPELVDRVAIVRDAPVKAVRSATAMQSTVATSPEYPGRLREIPGRMARMRRAIGARDAETLFDLVIEECDSFRQVCETTRPSLDYLTGTSRRLLAGVRAANRVAGRTIAGYTHDAGAHVHIFTTGPDLAALRRALDRLPGVERWLTLRPGGGGRTVRAAPYGARTAAR